LKRVWMVLSVALLMTAAATAGHSRAQAGEESKAGHEAGESSHETLWKVVNFAVLAGVLGYFIGKNAGPFFKARTEEIRRGLDDAARQKQEAEANYAATLERLANIGTEIENLRNQGRAEANAEGDRVRAELERSMARIRTQAEQEIEAAAKVGRRELRKYAAELAVGLAKQRIRERLTPASDDALLAAMLKDLAKRPDGQSTRVS
jgi:F-type H+-transporting ATPase subunit b